ncbi:MAG: acyl-CoA synthetase (NDP forming) [Gammaproteobacteria bacterium]|jgi:acyl-CoA synthetase (NDP forming)
MSALDAFFKPRGVALIGASADATKLGGRRYRSLVEGSYAGAIYPVNPRANEIRGHRAYASVADVPQPLDLAVIMVRADLVLETVAACARRAIPAVMVITAGFAEVNAAGRALEREMIELLAPYGGRLMGPNCAGLFNHAAGLNIGGLHVPPGPIGLVSQSGNLVLDFARHAALAGSGISRYAAIGNAADVRPIDVIENLLDDDATTVVLAYLEGWSAGEGRRLYDLVRHHPSGKPLVVLKPGRSAAGRSAALSHTGSLAGEDRIVDAAFRQAGIWRASNAGEAWDAAITLARYRPAQSERAANAVAKGVAILTDGGGHATLLADALGLENLEAPVLDEVTQTRLRAVLPERCSIVNPVDFAGVVEEDPAAWSTVAALCRAAPGIGAVALTGHFGGYHDNGGGELGQQEVEAAQALIALARKPGPPILLQSIHAHREKPALEILKGAGISVFRAPHELARALAALNFVTRHRPSAARTSVPRSACVDRVLASHDDRAIALLEPQSRELLIACGVDIPLWRVNADVNALARASVADGAVALKLIAPGLVHRSDFGGVVLDVEGEAAVASSAQALLEQVEPADRAAAQVMSTPMIPRGIETAFGAIRDPHFGPMVMFGLGGIHLQAIEDVAFRVAPLNESEARDMLGDIRAHRLLAGHRGAPPIDAARAARLLVQLGDILVSYPEIAEIDLNPVIVNAQGLLIADARVILTGAGATDKSDREG